jgi:hypothetical protein
MTDSVQSSCWIQTDKIDLSDALADQTAMPTTARIICANPEPKPNAVSLEALCFGAASAALNATPLSQNKPPKSSQR